MDTKSFSFSLFAELGNVVAGSKIATALLKEIDTAIASKSPGHMGSAVMDGTLRTLNWDQDDLELWRKSWLAIWQSSYSVTKRKAE